jgi:hypothetical protein
MRGKSAALMLLAVFWLPARASADGGVVIAQDRAQGMQITLFAAPVPLRAGPVDLSIFLQREEDGSAILGAPVAIRVGGGQRSGRWTVADHEQATNRLLYAALLQIPEPGPWTIEARVGTGDEAVRIGASVVVGERQAPAARFWGWIILPLPVVLFFSIQQWLRRRERATQAVAAGTATR